MQAETATAATMTATGRSDAAVRYWLVLMALMVLAMIVVGGATRLTGSGLSITEWQPILGAIPPLSEADWQDAFAKYKQIPQYERVNKGMSLDAFKTIYLWEWGHRLLGRVIGLAFALPLVWFWSTGRLRPKLGWPLLGIFALGGLQGVVGWYMVQSGLVERIDVSQYRLALHLTIAFLILGALVWVILELSPRAEAADGWRGQRPAATVSLVLVGLLTVQVVAGALVAGMKAGLAYNTWPLMDGALVPQGLLAMSPWWLNAFENALTVQFNHRLLAYLILALAAWQVWRLARDGDPAAGSAAVLLVLLPVQAVTGIATLLAHVPLSLGLLHQGGGALVFAAAVWHAHATLRGSNARRSA